MDMNMEPTATREKKDDRREIFTSNHELSFARQQLLQISKELKNPRLRQTSVLAKQREKSLREV
jgi:hypothetical protein